MEIAPNLCPARPGKQHETQRALTLLPGSTGHGLGAGHLPGQAVPRTVCTGSVAPKMRKAGPGPGGLSPQLLLESIEHTLLAVLLSLQTASLSLGLRPPTSRGGPAYANPVTEAASRRQEGPPDV